jgi:ABC-2 type transport system permease protein
MTAISYRGEFFISSLSNLFFIFIIFNIWESIYTSAPGRLNGMTFNDTFIYLSLGSSLFIVFTTWCQWFVSDLIITGNIAINLIRPYDFQHSMLSSSLALLTVKIITTIIPTSLLLFVIFKIEIPVGYNLVFFILSILPAFLISFYIDYMVGVTAFYTESIWGVAATKDAIVLLLSGVLIPLPFFPPALQKCLMFLPFQAIYNTPLKILISENVSAGEYLIRIAIQCFWVIVLHFLSRFYYTRAIRVVTVAGG